MLHNVFFLVGKEFQKFETLKLKPRLNDNAAGLSIIVSVSILHRNAIKLSFFEPFSGR